MTGTGYIELICYHCEFYKPSDVGLECAAFKILKYLIETGKITEEDVKLAAFTSCGQSVVESVR